MIETFVETVAVCWLAVVGIFVGALILIDRRTQRRWEPLEVDRGEIVEPRR